MCRPQCSIRNGYISQFVHVDIATAHTYTMNIYDMHPARGNYVVCRPHVHTIALHKR